MNGEVVCAPQQPVQPVLPMQTVLQPPTTVVVTSGGDSGSEVGSDEGYRSLGVATTPPAGEKRSIIASVRDNEASGAYNLALTYICRIIVCEPLSYTPFIRQHI